MNEYMLEVLSRIVEIGSTIIINRYDPSHASRPILCPRSIQDWLLLYAFVKEHKVFVLGRDVADSRRISGDF